MKKKLFLGILPLMALAMTACGGGQPTTSIDPTSQEPTSVAPTSVDPTSEEATSEDPTSVEPTSVDPTSEEATSEDPTSEEEEEAGYDALTGIGAELSLGGRYYAFTENETPDLGRLASYSAFGLDLTKGQKIGLYFNGEAISAWAEADADHGVYPNYDERPQAEKYSEFTVTVSAEGNAYLHENDDESYSFWLTPNQVEEEETGDADFYVVGDFNSWSPCDPDYGMTQDEADDTHYYFEQLPLAKGNGVKINDAAGAWYDEDGGHDGGNTNAPANGVYTVHYYTAPGDGEKSIVLEKTGEYDFGETQYYLVGKICGEEKWSTEAGIQLVSNDESIVEEYMLEDPIELQAGDGIKVLSSTGQWFKDGIGTEYAISEGGLYQVYFRPDGNTEWGYTYFDVVLQAA